MVKPALLVVEDNEVTRALLFTIFDSLGFDVSEIADGREVIPFLEKNKIDVMILDLELPGLSGDQIYLSLKKNPHLDKVPVIPFTARTDTYSPQSFSSRVIWTEYKKSGKIPTIIFKLGDTGEGRKITGEVIDEVSRKLSAAAIPLPKALINYYIEVRGGTPEAVLGL